MRPHYSHSSRENVTPSPLASYKEVTPQVFYLSTPPCLRILQAHLDWPLVLHAGIRPIRNSRLLTSSFFFGHLQEHVLSLKPHQLLQRGPY